MDEVKAVQWLMSFILKSFFSGKFNINHFQNFILMHFIVHLCATIFSPILYFEDISGLGMLTIEYMEVMQVVLPSFLIE